MNPTPTIKQLLSEPRVYALIVRSSQMEILHLGIHFSLDEAYSAARRHIENLKGIRPGEAIDIDLWNSIPAHEVMSQFVNPISVGNVTPVPEGTPTEPTDRLITATPQSPMDGTFIPVFPNLLTELPPLLQTAIGALARNPETPTAHMPAPLPPPPSIKDHIDGMKELKNNLMRRLIEDGDVSKVEEAKILLGPHSSKYVLKAIEKKKL